MAPPTTPKLKRKFCDILWWQQNDSWEHSAVSTDINVYIHIQAFCSRFTAHKLDILYLFMTCPSLQEIQLSEHLWIGAKEIASICSPLSAYYCLVWLRRVWMLSGQLLWATLFNILRSGLDAFGTNYFDNTVWHPSLHFITIYPYGGWHPCNQQKRKGFMLPYATDSQGWETYRSK